MRNSLKALAMSAVFGLMATTNAYAIFVAPTTYTLTPGTTYTTTGLDSFSVGGAPISGLTPSWQNATLGMAGIQVQAFFANGTNSGVLSWAATTGLGGDPGVTGTNWALTEWGNTIADLATGGFDYSATSAGRGGPGVWHLSTTGSLASNITSLVINLQPGNRSFDIAPTGPGGNPGGSSEVTPGSAEGNSFGNLQTGPVPVPYRASEQPVGQAEPDYSYTVLYTNALGIDPDGVGGVAPTYYGDEYTQLVITFAAFPGDPDFTGVAAGLHFYFLSDTDAATTTIIPNIPVPEPMTLALFGTGLVGIGALRRRRKAAK